MDLCFGEIGRSVVLHEHQGSSAAVRRSTGRSENGHPMSGIPIWDPDFYWWGNCVQDTMIHVVMSSLGVTIPPIVISFCLHARMAQVQMQSNGSCATWRVWSLPIKPRRLGKGSWTSVLFLKFKVYKSTRIFTSTTYTTLYICTTSCCACLHMLFSLPLSLYLSLMFVCVCVSV